VQNEAMHIDGVPNRTSRPAYLLRESYREGKKVRKRTPANLSARYWLATACARSIRCGRPSAHFRDAGRAAAHLIHAMPAFLDAFMVDAIQDRVILVHSTANTLVLIARGQWELLDAPDRSV